MRTPGHDEELALGFLYGEGLIDGPRRGRADATTWPTTRSSSTGPLTRTPGSRRFYTTSSCGVCGKGAIEEVIVHSERLPDWPREPLERDLLARLPDGWCSPVSPAPGGFTRPACSTPPARLICVREDVGRHNAMDKVIGWALNEGLLPLNQQLLCVSGRLSFELVQKAAVAGAPVLVGVGAPTSLAVELAQDRNLTLCGFARHGRMNIYSGEHRLKPV